jgi:hypothetical protein
MIVAPKDKKANAATTIVRTLIDFRIIDFPPAYKGLVQTLFLSCLSGVLSRLAQ